MDCGCGEWRLRKVYKNDENEKNIRGNQNRIKKKIWKKKKKKELFLSDKIKNIKRKQEFSINI